MKNKKHQLLIMAIGVLSLLAIITGVTYAFFSYAKQGSSTHTIRSGSIKFTYIENNNGGRGIILNDAMPMTDLQGKAQVGENNYFDFRVTASSGKAMAIPYTVTARVDQTSTLDPNVVKVWLSDQNNNEIEPVKFFDAVDATNRTDVLQRFTGVSYASKYNERVLYSGIVPAKLTQEYIQNFRLRAWIDNDTNFAPIETMTQATCSIALEEGVEVTLENCTAAGGEYTAPQITQNYPYNNRTFKITVNIYANGQVVAEDIVYNAEDIGYSNPAAPGVTNLKEALTDLSTKLQ